MKNSNSLIRQPNSAQLAFCKGFMGDVHRILGDKLHSFYIYGAMLFPRPANWRVDVDFHIIVASEFSKVQADQIRELHSELRKTDPLGEELDGYYILLADAQKKENPHHMWKPAVDLAWSLHRAHIHAGKFQLLYGEDPRNFVPKADWSECAQGLENEYQFIKENPQYAQFGILNLCRLLRSWQTKDVVTSKYDSAQWALENLDKKWSPAIEAALRDYEEKMEAGDKALLEQIFPQFRKFCASQIETLKDRA